MTGCNAQTGLVVIIFTTSVTICKGLCIQKVSFCMIMPEAIGYLHCSRSG